MKHKFYTHCPAKGNLKTFIVLQFLTLLVWLPGWSQKKQLTALGPVIKIAYLDPSALRKGYKLYSDAKEKIATEHKGEKKSFDQSLKLLDQQTSSALKTDSLSGGKKKLQIINGASSRRSQLTIDFQEKQKKRNLMRIEMNQQYERNIVAAIDSVVSEGGFTEVKAIEKGIVPENGTDITALVLKKLNQN